MKEYFRLQKTLIDRWFRGNGIHPTVGYILSLTGLLAVGWLALERSDYAAYGLVAVSLSALLPLAEQRRNDFLRITFGKARQRKIRLIENAIVITPIVVLLVAKQFWALTQVQILLGGALAVIPVGSWNSWVIPTPFGQRPFEFAVGFRRHWWVLVIAVFLTVMGLRVDNFALAAFAYFVVGLMAQTWYSDPEPGSYISIFSLRPRPFLNRKMRVAAGHLLILLSPFLLALLICFPERWYLVLLFTVILQAYVQLMLVMKYAAYPDRISLPKLFLLAFAMIIFPVLPFMIYYFYGQAASRLHLILPESSPAC